MCSYNLTVPASEKLRKDEWPVDCQSRAVAEYRVLTPWVLRAPMLTRWLEYNDSVPTEYGLIRF